MIYLPIDTVTVYEISIRCLPSDIVTVYITQHDILTS